MVSSTIYTNHSSSFLTTRIIWRKRICIGCSFHGWIFKDWPFDNHDSDTFRTGLGVVACSSHNTVTTTTPTIIQMSMHWIHVRWRSRMVMMVLWQQISDFHQHFLPFFSDGLLLSLDDVCLCFLQLDVFELLSTFLQSHIWLWYISLLWNFWLPLHSCSVLHDYCSIEAALVQYQILLKEVI